MHIFSSFFFPPHRQQLSQTYFDSPPISPKNSASVKCKAPSDKGQKCNSSLVSHFFQKKPRKSDTDAPTGRTRGAKDTDPRKATVKEEPSDVEEASMQDAGSVQQGETELHGIGTEEEMPHSSSSPPTDVKPAIKGEAYQRCTSVFVPMVSIL